MRNASFAAGRSTAYLPDLDKRAVQAFTLLYIDRLVPHYGMRRHERALLRTGDPSGVGRHRLCPRVGAVAHRSGAIEVPFSFAGARHREQSPVADRTERYAVMN